MNEYEHNLYGVCLGSMAFFVAIIKIMGNPSLQAITLAPSIGFIVFFLWWGGGRFANVFDNKFRALGGIFVVLGAFCFISGLITISGQIPFSSILVTIGGFLAGTQIRREAGK